MTITVIATGFGTDENGMPKKPNKTDDFRSAARMTALRM